MGNRVNRRSKILVLLTIIPLVFCGCWDEKIFEKVGFTTILGIESSESEMKITYAIPVTEPTTEARGEILETTASLVREATLKLRNSSAKSISGGKVLLMLYSKEISEKGVIYEINELFEREPSNPALSWVVVVDGSPGNLIRSAATFVDKGVPSVYITELLERSAKDGYVPEIRIFNYDITYTAKGIDNVAPFVKVKNKSIEVMGAALFSNGKMVGSISPKQNGLLMAMMNKLSGKEYTYVASGVPEDSQGLKHSIANLIFKNKRKVNIEIKNKIPVININLDLYGNIVEYKYDDLKKEEKSKKISRYVESKIQKDCEELVKYMQNIGSDPIGIGDMVRAKYNSYYNTVNWYDIYKNAEINVKVKYHINNYGIIQ